MEIRVEVKEGLDIIRVKHQRDELRAFLTKHKIGTEIYYPVSLHQQECFADWGYQAGAFPHSEAAAAQTLAIPIYPELTDEQIQTVVNAIAEFYKFRRFPVTYNWAAGCF